MKPINFSGMEDAITIQEPNGTHVSYHIFEESEIHLNRTTLGSVQEWHYHTRINECLLMTKGMLAYHWLEDGAEGTRKVHKQEIVHVESSIHTFANEPGENIEFVVFRFIPDGRDRRKTMKNDKVAVDR